jgi:hypothetical protein
MIYRLHSPCPTGHTVSVDTATWAVIASAIVGVTGVAVPTVAAAAGKRGDRRHEVTMDYLKRRQDLQDRYRDERHAVYLDLLTASTWTSFLIETANVPPALRSSASSVERPQTEAIMARTLAWGSDEVVKLANQQESASRAWSLAVVDTGVDGPRCHDLQMLFLGVQFELERQIRMELAEDAC